MSGALAGNYTAALMLRAQGAPCGELGLGGSGSLGEGSVCFTLAWWGAGWLALEHVTSSLIVRPWSIPAQKEWYST